MLTFAFVVMKFSLLPFSILAEKQRWAGKAENKVQEAFTLREDFYKPVPLLSYVMCQSSERALLERLYTHAALHRLEMYVQAGSVKENRC